MDKKNYTLSKVIDFVTKGEDSSNVDSDEEEKIVILPSTEGLKPKLIETVIFQMTKTKELHTICLTVCWQPFTQQTLSSKILMKAIKQAMMNHTSIFLRDRNKTRKKVDTDSAHDIVDLHELPAKLSDSIKTPFDAFWNIYCDDLLDIITTQTNIYDNSHFSKHISTTGKR